MSERENDLDSSEVSLYLDSIKISQPILPIEVLMMIIRNLKGKADA
jgi:hypothetical protein